MRDQFFKDYRQLEHEIRKEQVRYVAFHGAVYIYVCEYTLADVDAYPSTPFHEHPRR